MVMNKMKYADAGMDMKKTVLLFMQKIWAIFIISLIGAVLSGVIYTVAHTVPESEREYRSISKLYLDFAADETGEVYQAYNGYTWNDLMATEPILDVTMQNLPADYSRSEVVAATEATILSDLRLLTITITTNDPVRTTAIAVATNLSLESLGNTAKEFIDIRTVETTVASLVVADSRLVQAVVLGFVVVLVCMVFVVLLLQITDDRILVASDLRAVTDIPFIGYAPDATMKTDKANRLLDSLRTDCENTFKHLHKEYGMLEVCIVKQGQSIEEKDWEKYKKAGGVVLQIPADCVHAVYLAYLLEQFRVQDCKIVGIAIADSNEKWLQRYYGRIWS